MMNKILLKLLFTVLAVLLAAEVMAQVPQGFNFQAVARDANGDLIVDQTLGVQISILSGSETGTVVYTETQNPETNASGSFQIVIGEGTSEDNFGGIDWSSDNYYVKLEIDPAGGTSYEELGTTRLLSVPYALLAQDVVNGVSAGEDLITEFNLNSAQGDTSFIINMEGDVSPQDFIYALEVNGSTTGRNRPIVSRILEDVSNVESQYAVNGRADGLGTGLHIGVLGSAYNLDATGNTRYGVYGQAASQAKYNYGVNGSAFGAGNGDEGEGPGEGSINFGLYGYATGNSWNNTGIEARADGAAGKFNTGVTGMSGAGTGSTVKNHGVVGRAYGPGINYGVYGAAWDGAENYAGYFDGPTVINGDLTVNGTINSGESGSSSIQQVYVENETGDGVVNISSHGTNNKQGIIELYGETPEGNDGSRAVLAVTDNEGGDSWGSLNLRGPVFDSGFPRSFVNAQVSNDPGGNDPTGWFGQLDIQGNSSPNIQMGAMGWESSDLPMIQLFGNKPNNDGWFYNHANFSVNRDGDQEWGTLSLSANDGVANVEIGAKSWEDPAEGAGRPYMSFKGNTTDDLIYMEVSHDGANEFGNLNFNSTNGSSLSISAYGLNGDVNIDGGSLHVSGDITAGGSITETSDRNLKENIQPLQNGISTIMKLNPSTYNFRGNGEYNGLRLSTGLRYGLIAQEVEEVLPSLVKDNIHTYTESENSGSGPDATAENEVRKTMEYKSMNYTELVPILIKAVQEQQEVIEQLQKEVEKLKKD